MPSHLLAGSIICDIMACTQQFVYLLLFFMDFKIICLNANSDIANSCICYVNDEVNDQFFFCWW